MPKYHDEVIMGRMYENMYRPVQILTEEQQLLLEKSPLGQFFKSSAPVTFMHSDPEIGLVHNADVQLYPVKNELHFKQAIQRGDAVLVVDPNGDRFLIKQRHGGEEGMYTPPGQRTFSKGRGITNHIWKFNERGYIGHTTRPTTGQYPPEHPGSNIFIDYFDIKGGTHAKGYIIPNEYFRAAKLPDTGTVSVNQLAQEIIQQYGGAIVRGINKNLDNFLEVIKNNMSEPAWTDKDVIEMVQDYRRFLGIRSKGKIGINDIVDDLKKFISKKTEQEDLKKITGHAFASDEEKRQFAREFVLDFNKKFSPARFMNQVIDTGMDLF